MWEDLIRARDVVKKCPEIRCLIVRGEGRSFSSGLDTIYFEDQADNPFRTIAGARSAIKLAQRALFWLGSGDFISLAAVHGAATGAGCELALACDIRLARRGARFSLPEVRYGLIPDLGSTFRLPRLIGSGRAMVMMLDCAAIEATEASELGLVDRVVETLDPDVGDMAQSWGNHSAAAIRALKRTFGEPSTTIRRHLAKVADFQAELLRTKFA